VVYVSLIRTHKLPLIHSEFKMICLVSFISEQNSSDRMKNAHKYLV